jgi:hypothetical protein
MNHFQQTKYDIWATNALFFAFGLSIVMNYVTKKGFFASPMTTSTLVGLIIGNGLMLGLFYYIRKGLKGAKTSFLIIYALVVLKIVSGDWIAKSCDTPLNTFDFISQHTLQVAASILLIISLIKTRNTELAADEAKLAAKRSDLSR